MTSPARIALLAILCTLAGCTHVEESIQLTVTEQPSNDCVILLHGLGRTAASMDEMAKRLRLDGYVVANIGYPSRTAPIEELSGPAVQAGLAQCRDQGATSIHFVTHSLGGILVRHYLKHRSIDELGRTVMLAPPNQGSEAADVFRKVPGYRLLNGAAGQQIGTGVDSLPLQLGPVDFDVGIIAGDRTIDPITSLTLPNPDDGKVPVARTKIEGMNDFLLVHRSHAFIMKSDDVIDQVRHYLIHGGFHRSGEDG